MANETIRDVPSPIDLRLVSDARDWAARAEQRPGRGEILEHIAEAAAGLAPPSCRVLELGSGPGVLAERLLRRLPEARYSALDFSPAMQEPARARLAPFLDRVAFLERSFKSETWSDGLAGFDLVVTNQAVHELRHKHHAPALHRQVRVLLAADGAYLVSDHFSDPGGLPNAELYMTKAEQKEALLAAGFARVERLAVAGSLALHLARKR